MTLHDTPEYEGFGAALYDAWQVKPNTNEDARAFACILDSFEAKTVLELGAGTGRLLFGLSVGGRIVDGIDASVAMRKRYERQVSARALQSGAYFTVDFRSGLDLLERRYDAVIASRNTLGHVLTEDDLEGVLAGASSRLTPRGVAVFDLDHFRSDERFTETGTCSVRVGTFDVRFAFRSVFDPRAESVTFSARGTRRRIGARSQPERFVIRSLTRAWRSTTLQRAARRCGLHLVSVVDDYGNVFERSEKPIRQSRIFIFRRERCHA